jgi:hypothetical protein
MFTKRYQDEKNGIDPKSMWFMKPEQFKEHFIQAKANAHTLKYGDGGYQIARGMAHSVAGWVEDAFALYVAEELSDRSNQYYVDKVVSYKFEGMDKSKSFKPDVLCLKQGENNQLVATHMFDLKTDLGFNRMGFDDFIRNKQEFIQKIRGNPVWTSVQGQNGYEKIDFHISSAIQYTIVVVIDWNMDKGDLQGLVDLANQTDEVNMYILLQYVKTGQENDIKVNKDAFELLNQLLKKI